MIPTYLETLARDRLEMMKEGETIFRLEARAKSSDRLEFPLEGGWRRHRIRFWRVQLLLDLSQ